MGSKTVRLTYTNSRPGRVVHLDRLDVRDAAGRVVDSHEIEDVEWLGRSCNGPGENHFSMGCVGSIDVPINSLAAGSYVVEVVAWADQAGAEFPRLNITVLDTEGSSGGGEAIRRKLVELHDKLLGVQVTPDSPDVAAAYQLFTDVAARGHQAGNDHFEWWRCNVGHDHLYLEGILDGAVVRHENDDGWWYGLDWGRVDDFMNSIDMSDPHHTAQAWMVVLTAMMMDDRYLYLH